MGSTSIDALAKKVQSVKDRFDRLERDVRGLKDLLNVHDNWHSTIRDWVGREVRICDRSGIVTGRLKWSDRYNVCVEVAINQNKKSLRMYTKGGINWITEV